MTMIMIMMIILLLMLMLLIQTTTIIKDNDAEQRKMFKKICCWNMLKMYHFSFFLVNLLTILFFHYWQLLFNFFKTHFLMKNAKNKTNKIKNSTQLNCRRILLLHETHQRMFFLYFNLQLLPLKLLYSSWTRALKRVCSYWQICS